MEKEITKEPTVICDSCETPIEGEPYMEEWNSELQGKKFCDPDCAESYLYR